MNPIAFITAKPDLIIAKKDASFSPENSINSMSFLGSIAEVAKAQKMVVTDGAGLKDLGFLRNKEDMWKSEIIGQEDEIENKVREFLGKIKRVLKNNREKGGEK